MNAFADKVRGASKGDLQATLDQAWKSYAESYPDKATGLLYKQIQDALGLGGTGGTGGGDTSYPSSYPSSGSTGYPSGGTGGGSTTGSYPSGGTNGSYASDIIGSLTGGGGSSKYEEQLSETISNLEKYYRDLYGSVKDGDYTKKPYYQTILEAYGLAGSDAADGAAASGAGANGGNLDSYAAANARRQELSYKNAAQSAALNAYNSDIKNMLDTLSGLGVNVNDLYGTWGGDRDSQRSSLAQIILGRLNADSEKYQVDKNSELQKFLGQLTADQSKYQTDIESELQKTLAKLGYSSQEKMNSDTLASNERIAAAQNRLNAYLAQIERLMNQDSNNAKQRLQETINEANRYISELETDAQKYGYDKNKEIQNAVNELNKYAIDNGYTVSGGKITAPKGTGTGTGSETELTDDEKAQLDVFINYGDNITDEQKAEYDKYVADLASKGKFVAAKTYIDSRYKVQAEHKSENPPEVSPKQAVLKD